MAEALKLKVDRIVFQETLNRLTTILGNLQEKRDALKTEVARLEGETFDGTDVSDAIQVANDSLKYVQRSIEKVAAQRDAIQNYLSGTESAASTLQADAGAIRDRLPDIFA